MTKILVVDDEEPIVDAISYNLKKEGLTVETASDADECISRFLSGHPDLVILDVMLPSGSGLDLCRRLHRHNAALPVLLLTARAAEADCLRGFDAGADDYVVKPFSMRELMSIPCSAARLPQPILSFLSRTPRPRRVTRSGLTTWRSGRTAAKWSKTARPSRCPAKSLIS